MIEQKKSSLKKGNSSWQPANITDVRDKEDGYRYRWVNKNPDNMAKKAAEGWEIVNGLQADKTTPEGELRINDGKALTSTREKRDVILQRMPEEIALQRDAYYDKENDRRISGLTAHIKKEVGDVGGNTHGEITISSRKRAQE